MIEFDWKNDQTAPWLEKFSGLSEGSRYAVLSENTRPRSFIDEDKNLIIILRVINSISNLDEERLISLRLVLTQERIYSFCHYQTKVLDAARTTIETSSENNNPAELLVSMLRNIQEELNEEIYGLIEAVDEIEEYIEWDRSVVEKVSLSRKRASKLHRYLQPQRVVLTQVTKQISTWGDPGMSFELRELINELQISLEEVELMISRLTILQDELRSNLNQKTNRTLYLLSLVTFLFLPLSFMTGFLGMNIIFPWGDSIYSIWIVSLLVVIVFVIQIWIVKRISRF